MKIINRIMILILATRVIFSMEADLQPSWSNLPVEITTGMICSTLATEHDLISSLKNLLHYRLVNHQWNDICTSIPNVKHILSHCKQQGMNLALFEIIKAIFGKLFASISHHTPAQRAALQLFLKNNQFSLEQKIDILAPLSCAYGWYDGMLLAALSYGEYALDLDFVIPQRNARERALARAFYKASAQGFADVYGVTKQTGTRKNFFDHLKEASKEADEYDDLIQLMFNWFNKSNELKSWLKDNPTAITQETAQLIEKIKNADENELKELVGIRVSDEFAYSVLWATMVFGKEAQVKLLVKYLGSLERVGMQLVSIKPCIYITALMRGYFFVPRSLKLMDVMERIRLLNLHIKDPIPNSLFIHIVNNDKELCELYRESESDQYVNSFSQEEFLSDDEILVLLRAARAGNSECIKKCLPTSGQFKIYAKDLGNILITALTHGHVQIVRYLIDLNLIEPINPRETEMSDSDEEIDAL